MKGLLVRVAADQSEGGGYWNGMAGSLYHGSPGDLVHDLGKIPNYPRANTLRSREFCYFGAAGSDAYKQNFRL